MNIDRNRHDYSEKAAYSNSHASLQSSLTVQYVFQLIIPYTVYKNVEQNSFKFPAQLLLQKIIDS